MMHNTTQFLATLLKRYRRDGLRLMLVFAAVVIGNAGLVTVIVLNDAARLSVEQGNRGILSGVYHQVVAKTSSQPLTKSDYATLRRAGFEQLVATASVRTPVLTSEGEEHVLSIQGIDSSAILGLQTSQSNARTGADVPLDGLLQPPYQTYIDKGFAKHIGLSESALLTTPEGKGLPTLKVINMPTLGRTLLVDIAPLSARFALSELDALLVVSDSPQSDISQLHNALPSHLKLSTLIDVTEGQGIGSGFELNLLAMTLLMYIVCLFVVLNALQLLHADRLPVYRICRQLGVPLRAIVTGCLVELVILSLLCALAGVFVGVYFAKALAPSITELLSGLYGVTGDLNAVAMVPLIVKTMLITLVGVSIASWLPLHGINTTLGRLDTEPAQQGKVTGWLTGGGCLLAASGVFLMLSTSLMISLLAMGMLILGGMALCIGLIPVLLGALKHRVNASSPLLHWGLSHSVKISAYSRIAFCAFVIAVTANIGMNLMVTSFRTATEQWLEHRLVADYYVYSDYAGQFISTEPAGVTITSRKRTEGELNSAPIPIYSYPLSAPFKHAMQKSAQTAIDWQAFSKGTGVLINQQLAYREGLAEGDSLMLTVPNEATPTSLRVLAVYPDYGNPASQVLMPDAAFSSFEFDITVLGITTAGARADIEQWLDSVGQPYRLYDRQGLIALSLNAFDRTFLITDGLNIVTLLVATFSLLTSLLLFSMEDQPTRALLRSLGVSAKQLRNAMLLQYGVLCAVAMLLALPFGVLLSFLLINVINVQAFQWSYPLTIPFSTLTGSLLVTALVIMLALLIPINKLSKNSLAEELRCLR